MSSRANFEESFYKPSTEYVDSLLEKTASDDHFEYLRYLTVMKKLSGLKYKDAIKESLAEINRKGQNFACIFPAAGCEIYD